MDAGFRVALVIVLENGEPAEPAVFPTIAPAWHVGDTFLAGPDLGCLRILAMSPRWTRTPRSTASGLSSPSSGLCSDSRWRGSDSQPPRRQTLELAGRRGAGPRLARSVRSCRPQLW